MARQTNDGNKIVNLILNVAQGSNMNNSDLEDWGAEILGRIQQRLEEKSRDGA